MAEITRPPASYRNILQEDGTYGVEVTIAGTSPTIVTSFADEAAAGHWVEGHKARSLLPMYRSSFRSRGVKRA